MEHGIIFGRYRFDPSTGRLWSGKREIRLTPKAGAVLAVLTTRAGQPVAREDLFASVWRGTAVSDDALTSCVQELRKALADDPKQPRFIETRHRRGYCFIARLSRATVGTRTHDSPESRLGPDAARPAQTAAHVSGIRGKPTVAVLPFNNVSGAPDQEPVADGITEDLITALSRHRSLLVIAKSSTFAFKGAAIDVRRVGIDLGADYVVEGSVVRNGQRLRIRTRLVETEVGRHVWAERYDRNLQDVFEVQDEISMSRGSSRQAFRDEAWSA